MSAELYNDTATTLADALIADPFYVAITPANAVETRRAQLQRYFLYALQEGDRRGAVTLGDPPAAGAAIWLIPDRDHNNAQEERDKHAFLQQILSPAGYQSYLASIDFMHTQASALVPDSAWYLSIIGVAPTRQRQGVGERLLQPLLHDADAAQSVCYLETFNARSLPFYQKAGFATVATLREPTLDSPYWLMQREPHAPTPR